LANPSSDYLQQQCQSVAKDLESFKSQHANILPPGAVSTIDDAVKRVYQSQKEPLTVQPVVFITTQVFPLAIFRAQFQYLLSDFSAITRRRSERALLHLKRSIVADHHFGDKWREAFAESRAEDACEKLGAAHLLLHGIYAVKVVGEGQRTDLFFGQPMANDDQVSGAIEAYVLTEWKCVKQPSEYNKMAEDARQQSALYANGLLYGMELSDYRYIVLVSEKDLPEIANTIQAGIEYKHINIPVSPEPPSRSAKQRPQP
jgi:hypothetical protein